VRDRIVPRMNSETPAQLVTHLSHPNGWWRDTAQQLLVLKQDKSVVPLLLPIAAKSPNLLARFHAMWTLEGLGALKPALVRELMKDPEPRMRIQAIRASETLYKAGDRSFAADYAAMTKDADVDVVIQALLTINRWKAPDAAATTKTVMEGNAARGVQVVATTMLNPPANAGGRGRGGFTPEQQGQFDRGGQIYNELCFACHGTDAMGTPKPELATTMAPALAGSPRVNGHRDYIIKVVLNGLAGPVDGKTYTDMMIPMGSQNDEWIAAVGSFVRNNFGNSGGVITPADVARVRAASAGRSALWTLPELAASMPTALFTDAWKLTRSHNPDAAVGALRLTGERRRRNRPGCGSSGAPEAGDGHRDSVPVTASGRSRRSGEAAAVSASGAPVAAPGGFPRAFKVEISQDGSAWTPASQGTGTGPTTISTFEPVQAKFVRISLTSSAEDAPAWSVQNLRIYAITKPEKGTQVPSARQ
jgi:mono/diheme cytochrome c family protein